MVKGRKKLSRALNDVLDKKADRIKYVSAVLGAYVAGVKRVQVVDRKDFVWCRIRGATSERVQAFNDSVSHTWDLPILIYRDPEMPGIWKVFGRDTRRYEDWGGKSYIRPHGRSHSFSGDEGADPVWVSKRQYMPLLPHPITTGSMSIYIEPDFYYFDGQYNWWPGSGTANLNAYKPTGAYNARFVTVYIDGTVGNPAYLLGNEWAVAFPPDDPGDYIALPRFDQGIPVVAVQLLTGTKSIGWGELYDLRQPAVPVPTTGSALQIYDDHVSQGQFGGIDLLDAISVLGATGSTAYIDVAPPVTGTVVLIDEQTILGSVEKIVVEGDPVWTSITGSYGYLGFSGSVGPQGSEGATGSTGPQGPEGATGSAGSGGGTGTARTWGGWSVHYNFSTGAYGVGEAMFDTLTGSMVTQISCNLTDADGGPATKRMHEMGLQGYWQRITLMVWAEIDPEKWWAGKITSLNAINGNRILGVEYIDHGGGETPFSKGESVVISAGFPTNLTGTVVLYDEDTFIGEFREMRFKGAGVDVINSGSYAEVSIPGGSGSGGNGVTDFLALDDTPASYAGQSGTHVVVKGDESGLEFVPSDTIILAEYNVTGSVGQIDFLNINQNYETMKIVMMLRSGRSDNYDGFRLQFGTGGSLDTGANYRYRCEEHGIASTVTTSTNDTEAWIGRYNVAGSNADANAHGLAEVLIPGYSRTHNLKSWQSISSVWAANNQFRRTRSFGDWDNIGAIDTIRVKQDIGPNWVSGYVQLIGIGHKLN